jgi:hypothetical protein
MKPLEEYSLGERVVGTFIIVVVVILLLAFIGWLSGGWDVGSDEYFRLASAEESLTTSKYDDRLIALEKEAADNAYRSQVEHLFAVWLRDSTGQPARATTGARHARKAYIDVMRAVEKREEDLRKLRELSK